MKRKKIAFYQQKGRLLSKHWYGNKYAEEKIVEVKVLGIKLAEEIHPGGGVFDIYHCVIQLPDGTKKVVSSDELFTGLT